MMTNRQDSLTSVPRIVSVLVLSIFFAELLIMFVLPYFPPMSGWAEAMVDASGLMLLISPTLYFFIVKPLVAAKDAADAANTAKSRFLTTVSHELLTPMNGVIGIADILAQTDLNAKQRDMLATMRESAFSLRCIIDNILEFSRTGSGKQALMSQPFSVKSVVDSVVENLSLSAQAKDIEIRADVDPSIPENLKGDISRLSQVLSSLLGNAIKFTEEGMGRDRVTDISARLASIEDGHAKIIFQVVDNGIGISPEHQTDIFKVFSQVDSSATRRFGGTGLGLAMCAQMIDMMDGDIDLESTPGVGSTFTVTVGFPIHTDIADSPQNDCPSDTSSAAVTATAGARKDNLVLVAEDNVTNQKVIQGQLKILGYECDLASDGNEALAMFEKREYALLLTDCQMPNMDGFQLTAEIRKDKRTTAHFPIIAITANTFPEDEAQCIAAGMDDYLSKPVEMKRLKVTMDKWMNSLESPENVKTVSDPAADETVSAPVESEPAVDLSALVAVFGVEDKELFNETLEDYLASTREIILVLHEAMLDSDPEKVSALAHKLKSSSRTIGAHRLAEICLAMEVSGKAKKSETFETLKADFDNERGKVEAFIQEYLSP